MFQTDLPPNDPTWKIPVGMDDPEYTWEECFRDHKNWQAFKRWLEEQPNTETVDGFEVYKDISIRDLKARVAELESR